MKLPSTSEHPTAAGCISGFLRRLRRPPAAPIDAAAEETGNVTAKKAAKTAAPGIVARLMGLESMPVHPYPLPVHVARSRSTNSLDGWPVLTSAHKRASSDPAIRASVSSFREVPAYLTRENEEFLLLSFAPDNREEKAKMSYQELRVAKTESRDERTVEIKGQKQINMRRDRCRENYPERRNQSTVKESGVRPRREAHREPRSAAKRDRPIRNRKKLARAGRRHEMEECSCQDSSPVSVLDDPWDTDGESPASDKRTRRTQLKKTADRYTKPRQMDSKRKLLSDLANRKHASLSIHNTRISGDEGIPTVEREKNELSRSQQTQKDFSVTWGLVCRMAEEDVKASYWLSRGIQDDGEIAALVGVELLDFLLYEVVAEFSYCHTTTLNCT